MLQAAFSNIAWDITQDEDVARILGDYGIRAIECAPTKYFPQPSAADHATIQQVREQWQARGFRIVAMQALLFGQPQLQLLRTAAARQETVAYLSQIMRVGAQLGAQRFVFGSPKNRDSRDLPPPQIAAESLLAWQQLAAVARDIGGEFCLEPNPAAYDCNYVLLTTEAFAEAQRVESAGFGINLDTGIMLLNGEDPREIIPRVISQVRHVHLSEPYLAAVGRTVIQHQLIAELLREQQYAGFVSVEMRSVPDQQQNLAQIRTACEVLRDFYLE